MPNASELTPDGTTVADRFRNDLSRLRPALRDAPVLAAVSGGADSLALMVMMQAELGDRCYAVTIDHGLRPVSAAEADHVAAICAKRGIRHAIMKGDLPSRAGRTANVSARARLLRYDLLERHRRDVGAAWIATAHHADDQLETMIMRLNRGAGVGGLAGIRENQGHVIRPLLEWRRDELARITRDAGLAPIDDPSNCDERYDRARLRRVLAGVDWLDRERFAHSAHCMAAADEALDWAADELFDRCCTLEGPTATHLFRVIPRELHRRIIRRCIRHVDSAADCGKLALSRVMLALLRGEQTMIGNVLCSVERRAHSSGKPMAFWHFRAAPARRSH